MNVFISPMPPGPEMPLKLGSIGPNVRILQENLNAKSCAFPHIPPLALDGVFGPETESSVIAFQRQFSLMPDAVVGPVTWAEIMRQASKEASSVFFSHTVVPGDTLWMLAQRFGTTVDAIRSLNNLSGDVINVGQVLKIPSDTGAPPPEFFSHTVVPGDTLWMLAQRFGTTVDAIRSLNNLSGDVINVGQVLKIPSGTGGAPPPPAAMTIVLDPGHGGSDPGAVFGTRLEKNDNLRFALAVQRILQERGQRVVMTRSTDVFIPLAERSAISNRNNADIFVSIHRNASTNPAANGVENYVFTNANDTAVLYAFNVLDEIVSVGVQSNGGVIRANFAVLRNTNAPAMLVELGYISNVRDNQLFDQNFNAYASAVARGIMESLRGPSLPPPSYFFYTVVRGDNLLSIAQRFKTTVNAIVILNKLTSTNITLGQVLKIPRR